LKVWNLSDERCCKDVKITGHFSQSADISKLMKSENERKTWPYMKTYQESKTEVKVCVSLLLRFKTYEECMPTPTPSFLRHWMKMNLQPHAPVTLHPSIYWLRGSDSDSLALAENRPIGSRPSFL
jgi:hypothetical protein